MNTKNILVVEDDDILQELFQLALSSRGYNVIIARDGVEAVLAISGDDRKKVDFVMMDVRMPKLDGFNALKIIKKIAPDLPVVIFTGYIEGGNDDKIIQEAMRLGALQCLIKPFSIDSMVEILLSHDDLSQNA